MLFQNVSCSALSLFQDARQEMFRANMRISQHFGYLRAISQHTF
jgi:hypothetical protein